MIRAVSMIPRNTTATATMDTFFWCYVRQADTELVWLIACLAEGDRSLILTINSYKNY